MWWLILFKTLLTTLRVHSQVIEAEAGRSPMMKIFKWGAMHSIMISIFFGRSATAATLYYLAIAKFDLAMLTQKRTHVPVLHPVPARIHHDRDSSLVDYLLVHSRMSVCSGKRCKTNQHMIRDRHLAPVTHDPTWRATKRPTSRWRLNFDAVMLDQDWVGLLEKVGILFLSTLVRICRMGKRQ